MRANLHRAALCRSAVIAASILCGVTARAAEFEALPLVREHEEQRIRVMAEAAKSTVCILDENLAGGGSGVLITSDGYGLTNFHVIAGMMRSRRGLGGLSDGKAYPLRVLGIDPTGDVAMFRMSGADRFVPAPLGDSDSVQTGDWVFAMGNPFLLAEDYTPTVTHGIVSGVHRYQFGADGRSLVYTDCIQVDASINPGNSGGPLFDMSGHVIGINGRASFEQRGRVNVGLGYAISINQMKRFIPGLRAGLLTEHGSLGATVIDLGYRNVVFEKMLEPSVASAAGIAIGDRLVEFDRQEIHSANQFANLLGVYPAGWPVEVTFEHDGKLVHRTVRLERLPARLPQPFEPDEELNRLETDRVLAACRSAIGRLPGDARLTWRGRRTIVAEAGGAAQAFAGTVEASETAGEGTCRLVSNAQRVQRYNGRTATDQREGAEEQAAGTIEAARLNVWLVLRRALFGDGGEWHHVGSDSLRGGVADLLEYTSDDAAPLRVAVDPVTPEPGRAFFPNQDENSLPIEVEFSLFREVAGVHLPHRIRVTLFGQAVLTDDIEQYTLEASP